MPMSKPTMPAISAAQHHGQDQADGSVGDGVLQSGGHRSRR